ncbi:MAG: glycosyltransferase family 10 [Saprospiraceae bacterium]
MKKSLGIAFSDFWPELDPDSNIFVNTLRKIMHVEIRPVNPDLVFFSYYGKSHIKYRCPKVFYTGENYRPDYNACDFSISFDYPVTERNFRLPLYPLYGDIYELCKPKDAVSILKSKTKFCNFVVSNPQGKERNKFFKQLSKYKKVDSGGRFMNNIGHPVTDKNAFVQQYKFTLAFENSSYPGYTTEKIFQPMMVDSMPVYWGNPLIHLDFNTKSFINVNDYPDFESAIEQVIALDKDDDLYLQYMNQPYFLNNKPNEYVLEENLIKFLSNIISNLSLIEPVANDEQKRRKAIWAFYKKRIMELADFSIRNIRRIVNS